MSFLSKIKTLDSFHNANFRAYFLGLAGQWAAQSMQMVVQSLLVYRLTESTALLGTMALATALPMVVVALFSGVVNDRVPKKYVIQISQGIMGLLSLTVAILITTGVIAKENQGSWLILLCAGALQGALQSLMNTARNAIIPELVEPERVMNAVALNNMGMQTFQFIAPTIGGLMVDYVGFDAVYYLMACLCFTAVVLTNKVPKVKPAVKDTKVNVMRETFEGLKYIRSNTPILIIVVFTIACVLIASPMSTLISVFTEDILHVGGTGLGILQGMMAIGSFVASLTFASIPIKRRGIVMIVMGGLLGLVQAVFAFSSIWILSVIIMIFVGACRVGHSTPATTLLQNNVERKYLGRVISTLSLGMGLGNIMAFFNGVIAEAIGIQLSVGGVSLMLVFIAAGLLIFVPSIRKLE